MMDKQVNRLQLVLTVIPILIAIFASIVNFNNQVTTIRNEVEFGVKKDIEYIKAEVDENKLDNKVINNKLDQILIKLENKQDREK